MDGESFSKTPSLQASCVCQYKLRCSLLFLYCFSLLPLFLLFMFVILFVCAYLLYVWFGRYCVCMCVLWLNDGRPLQSDHLCCHNRRKHRPQTYQKTNNTCRDTASHSPIMSFMFSYTCFYWKIIINSTFHLLRNNIIIIHIMPILMNLNLKKDIF